MSFFEHVIWFDYVVFAAIIVFCWTGIGIAATLALALGTAIKGTPAAVQFDSVGVLFAISAAIIYWHQYIPSP